MSGLSSTDLFDGLNEYYEEVVEKYFEYAKHATSLGVKGLEGTIDETSSMIDIHSDFSQDEVRKIVDNLRMDVISFFKKELRSRNFSMVALLRQVFVELDDKGIEMKLNLDQIEDIDVIGKLEKMEQQKGKLKPIDGAKEAEEIKKLKKKNGNFRKRLTKIQKQLHEMMQEREKFKKSCEELQKKIEEQPKASPSEGSEVGDLKTIIEQLKKDKQEFQEKVDKLKKENQELKNANNKKIHQSAQFKNLQSILTKKNKVISELREELSKK